jgi:WD40 repeat protein
MDLKNIFFPKICPKRALALLTVFFFLTTDLFGPRAYGATSLQPSNVLGGNLTGDPLTSAKFSKVAIPPEYGLILEKHAGVSDRTVVLIQDAHDIPEAQENIRALIGHFQENYGLDLVALEGAVGKLDAQIFRSFPDQNFLAETLKSYHEKGELTGPVEAAILNKRAGDYHGIEDWTLYEEGLRLYRLAMAKEASLLKVIHAKKAKIAAAKKEIYPKSLWEIDRALERFRAGEPNLLEVLQKLSAVQKPKVGTRLAILTEEIGQGQKRDVRLAVEAGALAEEIRLALDKNSSQEAKEKRKELNALGQEFKTSRITPQAFALKLVRIAAQFKVPFTVSKDFQRLIWDQKRIEELRGAEFLGELKAYAAQVKATLLKTPEEKALDAQSEKLDLLGDFVRLESSFEGWCELQPVIEKKELLSSEDWKSLEAHIGFYRNSEARDDAFMKNLGRIMKGRSSLIGKKAAPRPAIVVAGGFHAERLTCRLKENGISYMLVMPNMGSVPKETNYRAHMRGDVSWKDRFEVENGRVNLYDAFVRATRDKLFETKDQRPQTTDPKSFSPSAILHPSSSAKEWRDQILRDLSRQQKIAGAYRYTRFLDETVKGSRGHSGLEKVDRFIEALRRLESSGQMTQKNILGLLKGATILPVAAGNAILGEMSVSQSLVMPGPAGFSGDPKESVPSTVLLPPVAQPEARQMRGEQESSQGHKGTRAQGKGEGELWNSTPQVASHKPQGNALSAARVASGFVAPDKVRRSEVRSEVRGNKIDLEDDDWFRTLKDKRHKTRLKRLVAQTEKAIAAWATGRWSQRRMVARNMFEEVVKNAFRKIKTEEERGKFAEIMREVPRVAKGDIYYVFQTLWLFVDEVFTKIGDPNVRKGLWGVLEGITGIREMDCENYTRLYLATWTILSFPSDDAFGALEGILRKFSLEAEQEEQVELRQKAARRVYMKIVHMADQLAARKVRGEQESGQRLPAGKAGATGNAQRKSDEELWVANPSRGTGNVERRTDALAVPRDAFRADKVRSEARIKATDEEWQEVFGILKRLLGGSWNKHVKSFSLLEESGLVLVRHVDGTHYWVDLETGELKILSDGRLLNELVGKFESIEHSPDGRWLILSSSEGMRLIDLYHEKEIKTLAGEPVSVLLRGAEQWVFSPDGKLLWLTARPLLGYSHMIDLVTGQEKRIFGKSYGNLLGDVDRLDFTPDGRFIIVTHSKDDPRTVDIFHLKTGKPLWSGRGFYAGYDPEKQMFWVYRSGAEAIFIDAATGQEERTADGKLLSKHIGGSLNSVGFIPGGLIWARYLNEKVRIFDSRTGEEKLTAQGTPWNMAFGSQKPLKVDFSPDGRYAAIKYENLNLMKVFDLKNGKEVKSVLEKTLYETIGPNVRYWEWSLDSRSILVHTFIDTIYHLARGEEKTNALGRPWSQVIGNSSSLITRFSADGRWLWKADTTGRLWRWDVGALERNRLMAAIADLEVDGSRVALQFLAFLIQFGAMKDGKDLAAFHAFCLELFNQGVLAKISVNVMLLHTAMQDTALIKSLFIKTQAQMAQATNDAGRRELAVGLLRCLDQLQGQLQARKVRGDQESAPGHKDTRAQEKGGGELWTAGAAAPRATGNGQRTTKEKTLTVDRRTLSAPRSGERRSELREDRRLKAVRRDIARWFSQDAVMRAPAWLKLLKYFAYVLSNPPAVVADLFAMALIWRKPAGSVDFLGDVGQAIERRYWLISFRTVFSKRLAVLKELEKFIRSGFRPGSSEVVLLMNGLTDLGGKVTVTSHGLLSPWPTTVKYSFRDGSAGLSDLGNRAQVETLRLLCLLRGKTVDRKVLTAARRFVETFFTNLRNKWPLVFEEDLNGVIELLEDVSRSGHVDFDLLSRRFEQLYEQTEARRARGETSPEPRALPVRRSLSGGSPEPKGELWTVGAAAPRATGNGQRTTKEETLTVDRRAPALRSLGEVGLSAPRSGEGRSEARTEATYAEMQEAVGLLKRFGLAPWNKNIKGFLVSPDAQSLVVNTFNGHFTTIDLATGDARPGLNRKFALDVQVDQWNQEAFLDSANLLWTLDRWKHLWRWDRAFEKNRFLDSLLRMPPRGEAFGFLKSLILLTQMGLLACGLDYRDFSPLFGALKSSTPLLEAVYAMWNIWPERLPVDMGLFWDLIRRTVAQLRATEDKQVAREVADVFLRHLNQLIVQGQARQSRGEQEPAPGHKDTRAQEKGGGELWTAAPKGQGATHDAQRATTKQNEALSVARSSFSAPQSGEGRSEMRSDLLKDYAEKLEPVLKVQWYDLTDSMQQVLYRFGVSDDLVEILKIKDPGVTVFTETLRQWDASRLPYRTAAAICQWMDDPGNVSQSQMDEADRQDEAELRRLLHLAASKLKSETLPSKQTEILKQLVDKLNQWTDQYKARKARGEQELAQGHKDTRTQEKGGGLRPYGPIGPEGELWLAPSGVEGTAAPQAQRIMDEGSRMSQAVGRFPSSVIQHPASADAVRSEARIKATDAQWQEAFEILQRAGMGEWNRNIGTVAFSRDARLLFAYYSDDTAKFFDLETHREKTTADGRPLSQIIGGNVRWASVSDDGRLLCVTYLNYTAKVFDLGTGEEKKDKGGELLSRAIGGNVSGVSFSPGSRFLLAGYADKKTGATIHSKLIDIETGGKRKTRSGKLFSGVTGKRTRTNEFSPDGRLFFVKFNNAEVAKKAGNKEVSLIDLETGEDRRAANGKTFPQDISPSFLTADFSPDGRYLIIEHSSDDLLPKPFYRFIDLETMADVTTVKGVLLSEVIGEKCSGVRFSPDSRMLLVKYDTDGGKVRVIDRVTGEDVKTTRGALLSEAIGDKMNWLTKFTPDSRSLWVAVDGAFGQTINQCVKLIDIRSGKEKRNAAGVPLALLIGGVMVEGFSPDSRVLYSFSERDGFLWRADLVDLKRSRGIAGIVSGISDGQKSDALKTLTMLIQAHVIGDVTELKKTALLIKSLADIVSLKTIVREVLGTPSESDLRELFKKSWQEMDPVKDGKGRKKIAETLMFRLNQLAGQAKARRARGEEEIAQRATGTPQGLDTNRPDAQRNEQELWTETPGATKNKETLTVDRRAPALRSLGEVGLSAPQSGEGELWTERAGTEYGVRSTAKQGPAGRIENVANENTVRLTQDAVRSEVRSEAGNLEMDYNRKILPYTQDPWSRLPKGIRRFLQVLGISELLMQSLSEYARQAVEKKNEHLPVLIARAEASLNFLNCFEVIGREFSPEDLKSLEGLLIQEVFRTDSPDLFLKKVIPEWYAILGSRDFGSYWTILESTEWAKALDAPFRWIALWIALRQEEPLSPERRQEIKNIIMPILKKWHHATAESPASRKASISAVVEKIRLITHQIQARKARGEQELAQGHKDTRTQEKGGGLRPYGPIGPEGELWNSTPQVASHRPQEENSSVSRVSGGFVAPDGGQVRSEAREDKIDMDQYEWFRKEHPNRKRHLLGRIDHFTVYMDRWGSGVPAREQKEIDQLRRRIESVLFTNEVFRASLEEWLAMIPEFLSGADLYTVTPPAERVLVLKILARVLEFTSLFPGPVDGKTPAQVFHSFAKHLKAFLNSQVMRELAGTATRDEVLRLVLDIPDIFLLAELKGFSAFWDGLRKFLDSGRYQAMSDPVEREITLREELLLNASTATGRLMSWRVSSASVPFANEQREVRLAVLRVLGSLWLDKVGMLWLDKALRNPKAMMPVDIDMLLGEYGSEVVEVIEKCFVAEGLDWNDHEKTLRAVGKAKGQLRALMRQREARKARGESDHRPQTTDPATGASAGRHGPSTVDRGPEGGELWTVGGVGPRAETGSPKPEGKNALIPPSAFNLPPHRSEARNFLSNFPYWNWRVRVLTTPRAAEDLGLMAVGLASGNVRVRENAITMIKNYLKLSADSSDGEVLKALLVKSAGFYDDFQEYLKLKNLRSEILWTGTKGARREIALELGLGGVVAIAVGAIMWFISGRRISVAEAAFFSALGSLWSGRENSEWYKYYGALKKRTKFLRALGMIRSLWARLYGLEVPLAAWVKIYLQIYGRVIKVPDYGFQDRVEIMNNFFSSNPWQFFPRILEEAVRKGKTPDEIEERAILRLEQSMQQLEARKARGESDHGPQTTDPATGASAGRHGPSTVDRGPEGGELWTAAPTQDDGRRMADGAKPAFTPSALLHPISAPQSGEVRSETRMDAVQTRYFEQVLQVAGMRHKVPVKIPSSREFIERDVGRLSRDHRFFFQFGSKKENRAHAVINVLTGEVLPLGLGIPVDDKYNSLPDVAFSEAEDTRYLRVFDRFSSELKVFDLKTFKAVSLDVRDRILQPWFARGGRFLIVRYQDPRYDTLGDAEVFDVQDGFKKIAVPGLDKTVWTVRSSPDSTWLHAHHFDPHLPDRLIDLITGKELKVPGVPPFSEDNAPWRYGTAVVYLPPALGNPMQLLDRKTGKDISEWVGSYKYVAAHTADGSSLFLYEENGEPWWKLAVRGNEGWRLIDILVPAGVVSGALSANGRWLAVGYVDRVLIYDVQHPDHQPGFYCPRGGDTVGPFEFIHQSQDLLVKHRMPSSSAQFYHAWGPATGGAWSSQKIQEWKQDAPYKAISPDGSWIVLPVSNYFPTENVRLYDANRKITLEFPFPYQAVTDFRFSPDGRYLSFENTARERSPANEVPRVLNRHILDVGAFRENFFFQQFLAPPKGASVLFELFDRGFFEDAGAARGLFDMIYREAPGPLVDALHGFMAFNATISTKGENLFADPDVFDSIKTIVRLGDEAKVLSRLDQLKKQIQARKARGETSPEPRALSPEPNGELWTAALTQDDGRRMADGAKPAFAPSALRLPPVRSETRAGFAAFLREAVVGVGAILADGILGFIYTIRYRDQLKEIKHDIYQNREGDDAAERLINFAETVARLDYFVKHVLIKVPDDTERKKLLELFKNLHRYMGNATSAAYLFLSVVVRDALEVFPETHQRLKIYDSLGKFLQYAGFYGVSVVTDLGEAFKTICLYENRSERDHLFEILESFVQKSEGTEDPESQKAAAWQASDHILQLARQIQARRVRGETSPEPQTPSPEPKGELWTAALTQDDGRRMADGAKPAFAPSALLHPISVPQSSEVRRSEARGSLRAEASGEAAPVRVRARVAANSYNWFRNMPEGEEKNKLKELVDGINASVLRHSRDVDEAVLSGVREMLGSDVFGSLAGQEERTKVLEIVGSSLDEALGPFAGFLRSEGFGSIKKQAERMRALEVARRILKLVKWPRDQKRALIAFSSLLASRGFGRIMEAEEIEKFWKVVEMIPRYSRSDAAASFESFRDLLGSEGFARLESAKEKTAVWRIILRIPRHEKENSSDAFGGLGALLGKYGLGRITEPSEKKKAWAILCAMPAYTDEDVGPVFNAFTILFGSGVFFRITDRNERVRLLDEFDAVARAIPRHIEFFMDRRLAFDAFGALLSGEGFGRISDPAERTKVLDKFTSMVQAVPGYAKYSGNLVFQALKEFLESSGFGRVEDSGERMRVLEIAEYSLKRPIRGVVEFSKRLHALARALEVTAGGGDLSEILRRSTQEVEAAADGKAKLEADGKAFDEIVLLGDQARARKARGESDPGPQTIDPATGASAGRHGPKTGDQRPETSDQGKELWTATPSQVEAGSPKPERTKPLLPPSTFDLPPHRGDGRSEVRTKRFDIQADKSSQFFAIDQQRGPNGVVETVYFELTPHRGGWDKGAPKKLWLPFRIRRETGDYSLPEPTQALYGPAPDAQAYGVQFFFRNKQYRLKFSGPDGALSTTLEVTARRRSPIDPEKEAAQEAECLRLLRLKRAIKKDPRKATREVFEDHLKLYLRSPATGFWIMDGVGKKVDQAYLGLFGVLAKADSSLFSKESLLTIFRLFESGDSPESSKEDLVVHPAYAAALLKIYFNAMYRLGLERQDWNSMPAFEDVFEWILNIAFDDPTREQYLEETMAIIKDASGKIRQDASNQERRKSLSSLNDTLAVLDALMRAYAFEGLAWFRDYAKPLATISRAGRIGTETPFFNAISELVEDADWRESEREQKQSYGKYNAELVEMLQKAAMEIERASGSDKRTEMLERLTRHLDQWRSQLEARAERGWQQPASGPQTAKGEGGELWTERAGTEYGVRSAAKQGPVGEIDGVANANAVRRTQDAVRSEVRYDDAEFEQALGILKEASWMGTNAEDVAMSPDGRWLRVINTDRTVIVFDAATGKERRDIELNKKIERAEFTSDSKAFAVRYDDDSFDFFNMESGSKVLSFSPGEIDPARMDIDADRKCGSLWAIQYSDGSWKPFDVSTGEAYGGFNFPRNISHMGFSPDGKTVVVQKTPDLSIQLYDLATQQPRYGFRVPGSTVAYYDISPDSRAIMMIGGYVDPAGDGKSLRTYWKVFNILSGQETYSMDFPETGKMEGISFFCPPGHVLFSSEGGHPRLIDALTGAEVAGYDLSAHRLRPEMKTSPIHGQEILESEQMRSVTMAPSRYFQPGVAFFPSANAILLHYEDNHVRFLDATSGLEIPEFKADEKKGEKVQFSKDLKWVMIVSVDDWSIRVVDGKTRKTVKVLRPNREIRAARFAGPDTVVANTEFDSRRWFYDLTLPGLEMTGLPLASDAAWAVDRSWLFVREKGRRGLSHAVDIKKVFKNRVLMGLSGRENGDAFWILSAWISLGFIERKEALKEAVRFLSTAAGGSLETLNTELSAFLGRIERSQGPLKNAPLDELRFLVLKSLDDFSGEKPDSSVPLLTARFELLNAQLEARQARGETDHRPQTTDHGPSTVDRRPEGGELWTEKPARSETRGSYSGRDQLFKDLSPEDKVLVSRWIKNHLTPASDSGPVMLIPARQAYAIRAIDGFLQSLFYKSISGKEDPRQVLMVFLKIVGAIFRSRFIDAPYSLFDHLSDFFQSEIMGKIASQGKQLIWLEMIRKLVEAQGGPKGSLYEADGVISIFLGVTRSFRFRALSFLEQTEIVPSLFAFAIYLDAPERGFLARVFNAEPLSQGVADDGGSYFDLFLKHLTRFNDARSDDEKQKIVGELVSKLRLCQQQVQARKARGESGDRVQGAGVSEKQAEGELWTSGAGAPRATGNGQRTTKEKTLTVDRKTLRAPRSSEVRRSETRSEAANVEPAVLKTWREKFEAKMVSVLSERLSFDRLAARIASAPDQATLKDLRPVFDELKHPRRVHDILSTVQTVMNGIEYVIRVVPAMPFQILQGMFFVIYLASFLLVIPKILLMLCCYGIYRLLREPPILVPVLQWLNDFGQDHFGEFDLLPGFEYIQDPLRRIVKRIMASERAHGDWPRKIGLSRELSAWKTLNVFIQRCDVPDPGQLFGIVLNDWLKGSYESSVEFQRENFKALFRLCGTDVPEDIEKSRFGRAAIGQLKIVSRAAPDNSAEIFTIFRNFARDLEEISTPAERSRAYLGLRNRLEQLQQQLEARKVRGESDHTLPAGRQGPQTTDQRRSQGGELWTAAPTQDDGRRMADGAKPAFTPSALLHPISVPRSGEVRSELRFDVAEVDGLVRETAAVLLAPGAVRIEGKKKLAEGLARMLNVIPLDRFAEVLRAEAVKQLARIEKREMLFETPEVDRELAEKAVHYFIDQFTKTSLKGDLAVAFDLNADPNFQEALLQMRSRIGLAVFPKALAKTLDPKILKALPHQIVKDLQNLKLPLAFENSNAVPVVGNEVKEASANPDLFGVLVESTDVGGEPFLEVVEKVVQITSGLLVAGRVQHASELKDLARAEEIRAALLKQLFEDRGASNVISLRNGKIFVSRALLRDFLTQYLAAQTIKQSA